MEVSNNPPLPPPFEICKKIGIFIKKMRAFIFIVSLLVASSNFAQPIFSRLDTIHVANLGNPLKNAWAGGLNFTEWSAIDVDLDGVKDLAIFDKSGEIIRIFKNDNIAGTASYTHAPQFQQAFPTNISSWVLFYDYNNDGKADLFTYALGLGGIRVYKNTSTTGNLQFTFFKNYVKSNYNPLGTPNITNTPSSSVALPALSDIDNDGDMDILTFQTSGIQLEYHKNMSVERYGIVDSLEFNMVDGCWGDAIENNCVATLNYPICPLMRLYNQTIAPKKEAQINGVMHSGSCLLCLDMDGDNDKDVILSDISCDSVEYFRNSGSITNAHFDYTTKKFPNTVNPIVYTQFPCTYFLDLDNDNKRDLIAAPNIQSSENYRGAWFFKNIGLDNAPNFSSVKKTFLQDEMLEFGEGAYPTAFDYDSDGDLDLIVGNFGYYAPVSIYSSKLALLKNIGTSTHPAFNLQTVDYMNLSIYNLKNMAPTFGDMDGDGDKDLIIGDVTGHLTYFTNTAAVGAPANFTYTSDFSTGFLAGLDVGVNAYPQIIDVNRDGLNDLLIGEYDGTLSFYENIGTSTSPALSPPISNFGNLRVNEPGYFESHSMPFLFDDNGAYKLMIGSQRGYLYMYGNIDGNLAGSFTLIDSIYNNIREGAHLAPCLADFNADATLDLVIGNYSGGLAYYKGSPNVVSIKENKAIYNDMQVFPNPTTNEITINFNHFNTQQKECLVFDELGREALKIVSNQSSITLSLENLQSGFYILQSKIQMPDQQFYLITKKIVKR